MHEQKYGSQNYTQPLQHSVLYYFLQYSVPQTLESLLI